MDPDALAVLYVSQWLHEHGYEEALRALERKTGVLYDDTKLERSSQLLQLIWKHLEETAEADAPEEGSQAALEAAQEEAMLRGGRSDYPKEVVHRIDGVHPSSVVCVRLIPGCEEVLTGSGDGHVRRLSFAGNLRWLSPVGAGGVLCMDLHPASYCLECPHGHRHSPRESHSDGGQEVRPSQLVGVGSMDGSVTVLHLATGDQLATDRCHAKYVVRVAWAGDGHHLVSCSHDQSVAIHSVELVGARSVPSVPSVQAVQGATPGAAHSVDVQEGGHTAAQHPQGVRLTTLRKVQYASAVQDVCFLQDGVTLVVALRDTNYLRVLTLEDLDAPEVLVNLNALGDDHVSFFARHLVPSPCGLWLLVSASTGRLLVLRVATWKLAARFCLFTLPTEQFHQFCAAWHRDAHYVFAGAAGGQVWVYHVGSGKVVDRLPVHKINVRDLDYDADRNLLATASFDRSVAILAASSTPGSGAGCAG